jgi:translation initiation factor IF-3
LIKPLRINNQIRAVQVQVISDEGVQLGTMSTAEALRHAKEAGLDLVEVGPNVLPPITKIMNYGKYIYQKERQEKKNAGPKKHRVEQKTVRVGFKTGIHDLTFKAQQVGEFLNEGHIVKVELTLRGREKGLAEIGRKKLEQFLTNIKEEFAVQEPAKRGPYGWIIIITKKK